MKLRKLSAIFVMAMPCAAALSWAYGKEGAAGFKAMVAGLGLVIGIGTAVAAWVVIVMWLWDDK